LLALIPDLPGSRSGPVGLHHGIVARFLIMSSSEPGDRVASSQSFVIAAFPGEAASKLSCPGRQPNLRQVLLPPSIVGYGSQLLRRHRPGAGLPCDSSWDVSLGRRDLTATDRQALSQVNVPLRCAMPKLSSTLLAKDPIQKQREVFLRSCNQRGRAHGGHGIHCFLGRVGMDRGAVYGIQDFWELEGADAGISEIL